MALTLAKDGRVSEAQTKVDRYNQLYPNGAEKPLVAKLQLELEFQRELQKKREVEEQYGELFTRGRFLYAAGESSGRLAAYRVGKGGGLERLATYDVGRQPWWVMAVELPGSD